MTKTIRSLSKSKIMSCVQCPKKLWLELNKPELAEVSDSQLASFEVGNAVGEVARTIYDRKNKGILLDVSKLGVSGVLSETGQLIKKGVPLFEAGFSAKGIHILADVLMPVRKHGEQAWHLIEVKSSTSVKDYHRDDAAIQAFATQEAGVMLASVSVANIDASWTYAGDGNYDGLLIETDLTAEVKERSKDVEDWIEQAKEVATMEKEPQIACGEQCNSPFECTFATYCNSDKAHVRFPVEWLPQRSGKLKKHIQASGCTSMEDVPDELLNERQLRVKTHTVAGSTYFDKTKARAALAAYPLPAYFLDFETIAFAVPIWKGTRPYQQIPFQYSLHRITRNGELQHCEFLDISGDDPSRPLAQQLVMECGKAGPIFSYNASFERSVINRLSERFPVHRRELAAIAGRLVDLLPIAQDCFYHPSQEGSWSIKAVLPAMVPELDYNRLTGVQNGAMAQQVYAEAARPETAGIRREEIREQLKRYCRLDTFAMVRIWQEFAGRGDMGFPSVV